MSLQVPWVYPLAGANATPLSYVVNILLRVVHPA